MDDHTLKLMSVILAISIAVLGYQVYGLVAAIISLHKAKKDYAKLELAYDNNVCPVTHEWDHIKLAMTPLEFKDYNICVHCGFVSGTEYKLNKPGIEMYHNELKKRKALTDILDAWNKETTSGVDLISAQLSAEYALKFKMDEEVLKQFFYEAHLKTSTFLNDVKKKYYKDNG